MAQIQSKLMPVVVSCEEFVHPWTDSCLEAICGCYLYSVMDSFRIYTTVYVLALLMRCKIPTKEDLKRTVSGIIQSTAFLSGTAFGYSLFLCSLRRLLGNFNLLTVSGMPAFLASVFAILIERPSRRLLLCLYVSNVATETVWNMALSRNMVYPIKHGVAMMFGACIATLLYYYRSGLHKKVGEERSDSMFGVLRFLVGPYEEKDYVARSSQASTFHRQHVVPNDPLADGNNGGGSWSASSSESNTMYHLVMQALRVYKKLIYRIKCLNKHHSCPHPFSCVHYTMQGASKMFGLGFGIQIALKLVLNIRRIVRSPQSAKAILFRRDILSLGAFLGGFAGIFRAFSCVMRRATGKDSPYHAIPAALLASTAFKQYPDTTVALYVLWKMAQITYNLGIDRGVLPNIPGFASFLYCLSTATLFHAAILEPSALRPSYWKFLHSISGGRISCMNRKPLDVWGLNSSQEVVRVLKKTNTEPVVQFYKGCTCS